MEKVEGQSKQTQGQNLIQEDCDRDSKSAEEPKKLSKSFQKSARTLFPHVHILVTSGGMKKDGTWKAGRNDYLFDVFEASEEFKKKVSPKTQKSQQT